MTKHDPFEFRAADKRATFAEPPARDILAFAEPHGKEKHVSTPLQFSALQLQLEAAAVATSPEVDEFTPVVVCGKVNGKHVGAQIRRVTTDMDAEGQPVVYLELAED